jgi:hypothetical protein
MRVLRSESLSPGLLSEHNHLEKKRGEVISYRLSCESANPLRLIILIF